MISSVSLTHDSAPNTVDSFIEYQKAHTNNMASNMKFDREHARKILERIHGSEFPNEQITLVSGTDAKGIPIHRVVLIAASQYFSVLFGPNFVDSDYSEFILEEFDGQTVQAIVNFCYSGYVELTQANVDKLIAAASKFQIDLLEEKCWLFRSHTLDVWNATDVLSIADKFSKPDLRERAFTTICENFENIPPTQVKQLDYELLLDLMNSDKHHAKEETIFKRLLDWHEHNEVERRQFMPELLKHIRLTHITERFLSESVTPIYEKFNCSQLVIAESQRRSLQPSMYIRSQRVWPQPHRSIYSVFSTFEMQESVRNSLIYVEKYNSHLNSFEEVVNDSLGNYEYFGKVIYKHKLFILGGRLEGKPISRAFYYDLMTGQKHSIPAMSFPRNSFTPIVLGEYIYACGGTHNHFKATTFCERYDLKTNKWQRLGPLNNRRYSYNVTTFKGCIYISGGMNEDFLAGNIEKYDPKYRKWELIAAGLNTGCMAMIGTENYIYAIGGAMLRTRLHHLFEPDHVERYDPAENRWTLIGALAIGVQYLIAKVNICINDEIFVVLGDGHVAQVKPNEDGTNNFSFATLCSSNYISEKNNRHSLYVAYD